MLVLVPVEHPVDFQPLFIELFSIPLDVSDENSILKLGHFVIRPQERQVCEVDDVEVRLPEAVLAFGPLMPDEADEG